MGTTLPLFVRPDVRTLPLPTGHTITVKKRLNTGEEIEGHTRMYLAGVDGRLRVNPLSVGLTLVTSYLVDWTLTDERGDPVPIRGVSLDELTAAVKSLFPDVFQDIRRAIETHESEMTAEREAEKKTHVGSLNGPVISTSPSEPAGVSSGSAR